MAERGSYKPLPGFSLLNVPQVQASRAGVQLFNALGDVADTVGAGLMDAKKAYTKTLRRQKMAYTKTLRRQKKVDVMMGSLQSFTQYAKDSPNDPAAFEAKATAHRKAAIKEYAKFDPDGASELDYNLYADQLRMSAPIIKRNNDDLHATNRAYIDNALAYTKTLRRQKKVDVMMGSLQSFTQYAKDSPNDPAAFEAKATAHRKAAIKEYAKFDPDGASELDYNLYADQLRMSAPIIKRNNDDSHATNRAYIDNAYEGGLAYLTEHGAEDADAYARAAKMVADQLDSVGTDGLKTMDDDDAQRMLNKFGRDAAETLVRNSINNSENPAEYGRRLQLTEGADGLEPVGVLAPVMDAQGNISIEPRPVRDVIGAQAVDSLAAHAFSVANIREAGAKALTYDQLYAAKSTMSAASAAAKDGSLSPGGFRKWREAAIASSQTPEELTTKMVEIDNEEKAMPARNAGYVANSQGQVDSIKDALGVGAGMEAQTAYEKSIADAQSNPVQYVLNVLSRVPGEKSVDANTTYQTMIGAMEAGDFEAAGEAYSEFAPVARGILGAKGLGYDAVLLESDAAAISSRINNLAVPEGESSSSAKAAHLRGLSVVFGADTGKVIKQMFPDSLDTNFLAMAQMDFAGDSANLNNALDARSEVHKALGKAKVTDIKERVRGNELVSGFVASFPANGNDFNMGAAWQDNIAALAAWHVQRGMNEKDAVQAAAQSVIGANYHIAGNVRIPKRAELTEREIHDVERTSTLTFSRLLVNTLGDKIDYPRGKEVVSGYVQPDVTIEEFRKRVRWGSKLVTNKDESGVILVDVSGNAVYARDDSGVLSPVEFTWKEMGSIAVTVLPKQSVLQAPEYVYQESP